MIKLANMKILFVGDVMLGRLVNQILKKVPPDYVWGNTLPIFKKADLRICNLECVISDKGQPWSLTQKVFHFRSDAKNIEALKMAKIDLVSIANNHTLDFDYEALFEELEILEKAKIKKAGGGKNFKEASSPAVLEINKKKIGFIAFTDNEPAWEAKENQAGIFYLPIDIKDKKAKNLFEIIKKTKEKSDFLIVSAHWGPNWGYQPQPRHIPFAHLLIDSGADIIYGHSCHVFQGIEIYKGKPILYSTGDFIDDYAVDEIERNDQSFIFIAQISEKDMKISHLFLYPTVIRNFQACLADGEEAKAIANKMRFLCHELGTESRLLEGERLLEIMVE
jgi:poly-gamma-glutamate synthesis protein (capsule biosynthesis protein)